ncbi:MAG: efflux RND transporter permease subunit, partial [Myxococcota bacterium]
EDFDDDADDPEDDFDPALVDAFVSLVEADPERFPGGFAALGSRLSLELEATPIVEGEHVTDEDVEELRTALTQNGLFDGRLISADRTLLVTVLVLAEGDSREMLARVDALQSDLEANAPPEGMRVRLGGLPHLRNVIVSNIRADQIFLVPMTLLVCMLLLGVFLRWLPGVYLPIVAVALTAVMVVGGMALAGEPFNVLNNIIPTLLIIIGISDSIHLIGRYREDLASGRERKDAVQNTVKHMAVACLLTSVTTAVGLASLAVSKTAMLRHFGVAAGLGVMVAYVVTITFLPAAITWLRPPKERLASAGALERSIESLTRWLLKHAPAVMGVAALLLAASAFGATRLVVDHALLDQFDENDPVYETTRLLEDKLEGVRPLEIYLRAEDGRTFTDPDVLARLDAVLSWAEDHDAVLSTLSPMAFMRQTLALLSLDEAALEAPFLSSEHVTALRSLLASNEQNPLQAWITEDGSRMRLQVKVRDVGAQATMGFVSEIDSRVREALPAGVRISYTGEAYDGSAGMDAVVGDLLGSLALAVLIIFVLLTLLFRSVRLGLLSIPPNLIPLVFTMAYMVWRGIPLNAATVIIFSISLGLAVDGTIHVLARFREEAIEKGLPTEEALLVAARGTGRAIVISCITLMAGFAVLLFSNFVPVRRFGELIAVTVACTLFATLVVQPALLHIAGVRRSVPAPPKG